MSRSIPDSMIHNDVAVDRIAISPEGISSDGIAIGSSSPFSPSAFAEGNAPFTKADHGHHYQATSGNLAFDTSGEVGSAAITAHDIAIWSSVMRRIEERVEPQIFAAYLRSLTLRSIALPNVTVACSSRFIRSHINERFKDVISESIMRSFNVSPISLEIVVDEGLLRSEELPEEPPLVVKKVPVVRSSPTARPSGDIFSAGRSTVNPRYTFENFIVGSSNQFCHAAAMRVAEQPGKSYNPLFMYGGVGLGKTHLLHAIANEVLRRRPVARVLYLSSETFTNELILALRSGKMDDFKQRLRGIELLLIDDIQFMSNKERTQEEFFHTFNSLYGARHQIVITSDRLPQEIIGIEDRLKTRFSWGLTADLQAPDFETRVAIIKEKAAIEGCVLPESVARFISERISSNVRELEGALTRLHAASSLQRTPVTIEFAEQVLRPLLSPRVVSVSIDQIKKAVADTFRLRVSDIISKRRTKNLSFPRHIAIYLCRKHTTYSFPEIGNHFGGRDHSSVIHSAGVIEEKLKNSTELRGVIDEVERRIFS